MDDSPGFEVGDAEMRRCPRDWRKLWPKAQVRPIRWHNLRHTTGSLLKPWRPPCRCAANLRRSDPRITEERYTHVDLEQLRAAVNRMPVRVDNLAPNVDENVDGGVEQEKSTKKRNNYGVFEEREKGFELWQRLEKPQRVRRVVRQARETIQVPFPFRPSGAVKVRPIPQGNST